MSAGLSARGLVKRFGDSHALDGIDLDVARGCMVALTGANGAGKTTTLRVFATVLRPDAGTASIDGFDVVNDGAQVRNLIGVALVNERSLYWRLSARQNLVFFGRTSGLTKKQAAARAATLLDALALAEFADRPAAGLSAGQRQRVILARAMVADPPVLLVDEPMRGLDDESIEIVRGLLRGHVDRGNTTVVAGATIGEFADLCDEIVELERGRITGTTARSVARKLKESV